MTVVHRCSLHVPRIESVWNTTFTVGEAGEGGTRMNMVMEIRPQRWLARLVNPLIKRLVVRGVESDMDEVKAFSELGRDGRLPPT